MAWRISLLTSRNVACASACSEDRSVHVPDHGLVVGGVVSLAPSIELWQAGHTEQITGMHVCAFPSQVHPRAGTRPPPPQPGH